MTSIDFHSCCGVVPGSGFFELKLSFFVCLCVRDIDLNVCLSAIRMIVKVINKL